MYGSHSATEAQPAIKTVKITKNEKREAVDDGCGLYCIVVVLLSPPSYVNAISEPGVQS
jgi:hypothetical protein